MSKPGNTPIALVVRAPGTNRDGDVAVALELAGAAPRRIALAELAATPTLLDSAQMVVFAGGFSHADALGAGTLAALEVETWIGDELRAFIASGRPLLGICNGFQILVRTGLLPGSLTANASGSFVCRWVTLERTSNTSVWTSQLDGPVECPVAHGEGRYIANADTVGMHSALTYANGTDPNGSVAQTAGVTDATGLVLGLMPHPENHILPRQHPRHHRGEGRGLAQSIFDSGVAHVRARR
jgi:phosphoribosylformylglycinamidine synthase subunit PurQ / glutaminase